MISMLKNAEFSFERCVNKFMFRLEKYCWHSRSTSEFRLFFLFNRVFKHLKLFAWETERKSLQEQPSKSVQHGSVFKSKLILLPIMFYGERWEIGKFTTKYLPHSVALKPDTLVYTCYGALHFIYACLGTTCSRN